MLRQLLQIQKNSVDRIQNHLQLSKIKDGYEPTKYL